MKKFKVLILLLFTFVANISFAKISNKEDGYTQIRNATGILNYAGKKILIDPFFAAKGSLPGFEGTYNSKENNPLIDLPMPIDKILENVDAVIITHTHLDHWDELAQKSIDKNMQLFVQNELDKKLIESQGFKNITIVGETTKFGNITFTKTNGQHGTDTMYSIPAVKEMLGEAMGLVIKAENHDTIYVVGDTIWRKDVEDVVKQYEPKIIIMNTGDAQFAYEAGFESSSIIMGKLDVERMYHFAPNSKLIAVHMDTVNHGTLTRKELRTFVEIKNLNKNRVSIPNDGEKINFIIE